jgi:hypothetical protein
MNKIAWITGKFMLKKHPAAKVLKVHIANPILRYPLVAKVVQMLEHQNANHKPYGHGGAAWLGGIQTFEAILKVIPINFIGQKSELMLRINQIRQSGAKQLAMVIYR